MKKCPPGFICFENMTMGFIIIVVLIVGYSIYQNQTHKHHNHHHHRHRDHTNIIVEPPVFAPNYPYSNAPLLPLGSRMTEDILLDPYAPPLKDERFLRRVVPRGAFPINIPTNVGAVDSEYRQVGILTPERKGGLGEGGKDKILALMGRPLFTNRDKWQYYSMSDQNNSVKLPVMKNKRSCTNEYGCDQIYNEETIYVKGYNERFRVTIYDDDAIRYLPMI
jgi:hypothetical protein